MPEIKLKACALLLSGAMSGCGIQPWVKPFEQQLFAEPIMQPLRDPLIVQGQDRRRMDTEAAQGATRSRGGPCGC